MVMQRTAGRRSKPPVLEFARNVDATIAAALEGAGLVYRNGKWKPENTISAVFFMANALAALPVGTPVTVTTTGVVAATSGNVQGIVAKASTAAGQSIPILRQGSMTLTGTFPANSILYISDKGVLSTTAADTSYFVGFTTTANNAFFLIGGSGGSGSVNTGSIKVDGTTISNGGGVLSAISTNSPAANTLVRTQDNGKISTELLDAPSLFSGMQVRYLVPTNTTWAAAKDKCVVTASLPISVTGKSEYKFSSPFGTLPALAAVYVKNPSTGVWTVADTIYVESTDKTYGINAACPGDGYVYVVTGDYLLSGTYSSSAPRATLTTSAEVVVALYCQKVEVTATHIMGARQKYLVAKGTSWNRSAAEDTITLSDMPLKFTGGEPSTKKFVSPFGTTPVKLESWVLFAGKWRKEHMFYYSGMYFGHMAMCPGDGYIYFNYGTYPQNADVAGSIEDIPIGTTGTDGSTYTQYQICLVATVHEAIELPTVRAKDIAELGVLGSATTDLSALVAVGTGSSPIYATWYAPSNGFVTIAKTVSDSTVGALRMDVNGTAVGLGRVNENANQQVVSGFVLKGQKYTMYRTGSGITFTFTPVVYDTTALVLSDKATDGGGSTNPSYGLRVGEVRNYSRYDTEIASNASFVNISEATKIDTTAYPEFAALVGVTGQYPIAAASLAGAQTIPYLYLGTYNGGTAPKALTENISFGSDTTAMANNSIMFVTDGDETVNVALVTVDDAENPALTAPALLLSVESSTDIAPIEATMSATTSTTAEPATSGILIRYEEKT